MFDKLSPVPEWQDVDAERFRSEILPRNRPAVLRGLARDWPATREGARSPAALADYLRRFDAGIPADTLSGSPAINGHFFYRDDMRGFNFARSRQRIGTVLDALLACLGDEAPPAISIQGLSVPDRLPGFERENALALLPPTVAPRLWIGNRVTVAPHFDLYDNIAVVVGGRRRFILFPPDQLPNLYVGPFDFSPAGAPVSMVPPGEPDLERFPRYAEALAAAETAELSAGDAIFIPYMWWHGVESLERFNLLANYWWNDARPAVGSPFDVLIHAVLVLKDLPPEHRAAWRQMLDHYVFQTDGQPMAHLAPEHRGALGGLDPAGAARMRAMLARALSQV
ncbi:MAG: cupin-like domain-containing protein [Pseudomonadota bacterium]|nr:cupin-like domain-containing protein [Pseudomonadota bacterium]